MTNSVPIVSVSVDGQEAPDAHFWLNDYDAKSGTGVSFPPDESTIVVEYGPSDILTAGFFSLWLGILLVARPEDDYLIEVTLADSAVLEDATFTYDLVYTYEDTYHYYNSYTVDIEALDYDPDADFSSLASGFFLHIKISGYYGENPAGRLYYSDIRSDIPANSAELPRPEWPGWNDGYPEEIDIAPDNYYDNHLIPYAPYQEQPAISRFINLRLSSGITGWEPDGEEEPPMTPIDWVGPDGHAITLAQASYLCAPAYNMYVPINRERVYPQ